MTEKEPELPEGGLSAATDDDAPEGTVANRALDPRIRTIARAIGRHIAREHIKAWERNRRERARGGNGQE